MEGDAGGIEVELREGKRVIEVTGGEAAVAVRSESGERLYLPPDRAERASEPGTPDGPPVDPDRIEEGRAIPTRDGLRIVHPEPVTDFRLLR